MSDWKAMVSRPMSERKLYELLGEMLKAEVTWEEAEAAFKEMLDNDARYKKGKVELAQKDMFLLELRMRFRTWLGQRRPAKESLVQS